MKRAARWLGAVCLTLAVATQHANAQTLEDTCPGLASGLGGLIGYLVDDATEMALPGATAIVRFPGDDGPQEIRVDAGLDGVYRLCGVPVGTALELVASFAAFSSAPIAYTMSESFERVDLAISMVAGEGSGDDATASGDDRILMCPEPIGATRFFWCEEGWRLEQCEYEDLGTVRASRTGSGGRNASYEIMEQFHIEATRVGADAILNAQTRMDTQSRTSSGVGSRGASGQESVIGEISGQAIKLADPDCRGIG